MIIGSNQLYYMLCPEKWVFDGKRLKSGGGYECPWEVTNIIIC